MILSFIGSNAYGKVWTVIVQASSFSPNSLTGVVCGDTIRWTLGSGSHTTTSTSIPAGATTWDSPITGSNPTFNYKVPNIAGVYNYKCTPHGFTGSFTVTCSVNTNEENQLKSSFLYPSPFSSKVTLQYENADEVRIISITGITLKTIPLNIAETQVVFYLDDLNPGFYFYSILKEGVIRETKKIIRIN